MSRKTTARPTGPFTIVSDDNCNDYVIPESKLRHWYDEWLSSDEWEDGDVPEYAVAVDGGRVVFQEWKIV